MPLFKHYKRQQFKQFIGKCYSYSLMVFLSCAWTNSPPVSPAQLASLGSVQVFPGFEHLLKLVDLKKSNVVKTQDLLLFNEMHVDAHVNDEQVDLLAGEGGSHLLPPPPAHLLTVLLNNQVLRNNLHQSDNDDVGP